MVPVKFVEAKFTRTASRAVVKARKRAFLCLGYWKMMLPEQILAFLFWRRTRWLDELTKKIPGHSGEMPGIDDSISSQYDNADRSVQMLHGRVLRDGQDGRY